jgi:hypothetical protein
MQGTFNGTSNAYILRNPCLSHPWSLRYKYWSCGVLSAAWVPTRSFANVTVLHQVQAHGKAVTMPLQSSCWNLYNMYKVNLVLVHSSFNLSSCAEDRLERAKRSRIICGCVNTWISRQESNKGKEWNDHRCHCSRVGLPKSQRSQTWKERSILFLFPLLQWDSTDYYLIERFSEPLCPATSPTVRVNDSHLKELLGHRPYHLSGQGGPPIGVVQSFGAKGLQVHPRR